MLPSNLEDTRRKIVPLPFGVHAPDAALDQIRQPEQAVRSEINVYDSELNTLTTLSDTFQELSFHDRANTSTHNSLTNHIASSQNGRLTVTFQGALDSDPTKPLFRSPESSIACIGACSPSYSRKSDPSGTSDDEAYVTTRSRAAFSTPCASPRSSISSGGPFFSPDRSDYDSELSLEGRGDLLSESIFNNITSTHDKDRLYTANLGIPDLCGRGRVSELSVISDAGDQQHKQYERASEGKRPETQARYSDPEKRKIREQVVSISASIDDNQLQDQIFGALVQTRNPEVHHAEYGFLPKAQLCRLVNEDSVFHELMRGLSISHTEEQIRSYASAVCGETEVTHNGKPKIKSFRKIFALLVLSETSSTISKFLAENISDLDLPLVAYKHQGIFRLRRRNSRGEPCDQPLKCFGQGIWSQSKLRSFVHYQWTMLAPFFSQGRCGDVNHYPLQDQHILPFTTPQGSNGDDVEYSFGGFGKVFMVHIHDEHHNFEDQQQCKRGFAIKQLYDGNWADFQKEVSILKRFSGEQSHPHIVSLLATYEQFHKYHFIFYRAEGDLFKYWREIVPEPQLNYSSILWMASQCIGIAWGLSKLHRLLTFSIMPRSETEENLAHKTSSNKVNSVSSPTRVVFELPQSLSHGRSQQRSATQAPIVDWTEDDLRANPKPTSMKPHTSESEGTERFGRHGDINPGNILWYDEPDESTNALKGTLKITDFGQAELNSEFSRTRPRDVANTMTYRPPECDLQPSDIRQSYDIWCLGCVYLEFITWMLGGQELLRTFSRRRKTRDVLQYNQFTDTFFKLEKGPDREHAEVMIKPEVTKFIDELHQHYKCTDYLHKLLDMIQNNMLVVESKNRKSCHWVWKTLEHLRQQCVNDQFFATGRNPWKISKLTSEPFTHSVKVIIDDKMGKRIADNPPRLPVSPRLP